MLQKHSNTTICVKDCLMNIYLPKMMLQTEILIFMRYLTLNTTREGFSRKNIVAVSFFQNCSIHQYS